jgi:hypothetical protein
MKFPVGAQPVLFGTVAAFLSMGAALAGTLDDAKARLGAGDAPAAYTLLKPEERVQAGDPDYDYTLGVAALDAGRPTEAVTALERVLAVQPDHLQARAELGRAYIALNEPEAARRELSTVQQQESVPPEVRVQIDRYVSALDAGLSGGGTQISGNATFRTGYDSNVNNSTSDSRILIPAFAGLGFATLGPSARSQDDGFAEASGRMSVTHGLSIDQRLIADITASYRGNFDNEQFNQAIIGLNLGFAQTTPDHGTFTLSGQAQSYWVDDDVYRYTFGGLGQWTMTTAGQTDLGVYLQYAHLHYPNNQAQNANRYTIGATAGQPLGGSWSPYVYTGAYAGIEKATDSAFDNLTYWFAGARLGGEVLLGERTSAYASAAVEVNEYKDPEPLFLKERSTVRLDLTTGARYRLTRDITLGAEVSYTNADSNIPIYAYDRVVGSLSASIDF